MAFNVSDNYKTQIYEQSNSHQIKILFGGIEYEDADYWCEKLTVVSRIIPNGTKNLYLDNLVSKEATLILHNTSLEEIINPVEISIGTLVGDAYEYVPIGTFNIQGVPTTANGTTTISLRDNSVLLDFNYNALPLMEELNPESPQATLRQILDDICSKAGLTHIVDNFNGENRVVGIYDSTIKARTYISYIAEQCGAIPIINRYGELEFIYLNNLTTHTLDYFLVADHSTDNGIKISKTEYESGTVKFTTGNDTNDTLYVDTANVYIENQEQINNIHSVVNGFTIDTLKISKIIGNPAIDPYDIIEITTDDGITYRTLANNTLIYNGVLSHSFETTISRSEKKSNVTVRDEESFKKYVKNEIDNLNGTWTVTAEEINGLKSSLAKIQLSTNKFEVTINGMSNQFTTNGLQIGKTGEDINSLLNNTGLRIYNLSKLIAIFNQNGSGFKDLVVTGTIQYQNLLLKKGTKETKRQGTIDVIQGFWVENMIRTLEDLEG